ncbi:MAG: DUF6164 family protein [Thiotrichaceae bacterium]
MAVQIFRLRNVAEDEAEEVRVLLAEHDLEFYETPGGNWGVSMPALWLVDDEQTEVAKALIAEYQEKRFTEARGEYERLKLEGKQRTFLDNFRDNPGQFIFYLAGIVALIYITTMPFIDAGK